MGAELSIKTDIILCCKEHLGGNPWVVLMTELQDTQLSRK